MLQVGIEYQRGCSVQALNEYLQLWVLLEEINLQHRAQDHHNWRLSKSGVYSSKSAYGAFFIRSIKFATWKRIWKSWAPPPCKFFIWLAILNQCWTVDRLAKRGLPHLASYPLCDQVDESMQHVLASCVFSRQMWLSILQKLRLQTVAPQPDTNAFSRWWCRVKESINILGKASIPS